jgi:hypothetical protein
MAAFFHNFLPKNKVDVTDRAFPSAADSKLFVPEYLALKAKCPCEMAVN